MFIRCLYLYLACHTPAYRGHEPFDAIPERFVRKKKEPASVPGWVEVERRSMNLAHAEGDCLCVLAVDGDDDRNRSPPSE